MITYAHEEYIREAINGVLMQSCNFDVELIIANDSSTDDTEIIVNDYIKTNSTRVNIVYYRHKKNIGMMPNFIFALAKAKGKYVALCEGDDFWTDPFKLQKQIDFLEFNKSFSACFTDVSLLYGDEYISKALKDKHKKNSDAISVFYDLWIPTLTLVFRNEMLVKPLPKEFYKVKNGDLFLFYLLAQKGNIGYIDIVTGVYRQHSNGVWSGSNKLQQLDKSLISLNLISAYFSNNNIIRPILKKRLLETYWSKCKLLYTLKKYNHFAVSLFMLFFKNPIFTLKKIVN